MSSYQIEKWENNLLVFKITREEKRNAIDYEVMDGLEKALLQARSEQIKALVITGEGEKAFCSGGDLSVFHELKTEEQAYQMLSRMGGILSKLALLPKPTIALMNGTAVGGGCELATACDFRVAKRGIQAGFVQGKLAITTGWGGGTLLLEKLPIGNAMKMLFEAKRYSVDELVDLEFIHYIYDGLPEEGLHAALGSLVQLEGGVLAAYKEMLVRKWVAQNIEARMAEEIRQCAILWESEAHHQQVDKFIGRQK